MKMVKAILMAAAIVLNVARAYSYEITNGEIFVDATSNILVYQGRLERSGSPVSDTEISATSFSFSIYNTETGGDTNCLCKGSTCEGTELTALAASANSGNKTCLWKSDNISTHVVSGLFSVSVETPWQVFASSGSKYLEVTVASYKMYPREKIGAVPYALVAKKLENNASIKVSSMSLIQGGNIYLNDGCIHFNNNGSLSTLCSSTTASAINSVQGENVTLKAGKNIYFQTNNLLRLFISTEGHVGIGTDTPDKLLTVNGDTAIEGTLYGKDGGELTIGSPISMLDGKINGGVITIEDNAMYMHAPNISSDNTKQVYLSSSGYVGIGTSAPQYSLHVASTIYAGGGVRAGKIQIGTDTDGNGIKADTNLILQKDSSKILIVGSPASSEEVPAGVKMDVIGGIRADTMTVTGSTRFNGDVIFSGNNLNANNGSSTLVHLSSTIIHGSLTVMGNIGLTDGNPAYLDKNNTFTEKNKFEKEVLVSSDVYVYKHIIVGGNESFNFDDTERYLQVGNGNAPANVYIMAGTNADSALSFYRSGNEIAKIATAGNNKIEYTVNNVKVAEADKNTFTVLNDLRVGSASAPTFLVHKSSAAINSAVVDDNAKLLVNGQLYAKSIRFPDGTMINSVGSIGNPTGISAAGNVTINSNTEIDFNNGTGNKVMVIKDGKVGIGTGDGDIKASLHVAKNMLIGNTTEEITGSGNLFASGGLYSAGNIKTGGSLYTGGQERITSAGTVVNSEWRGNVIGVSYGGTGLSSLPTGILKGTGAGITTGKINLTSEVENILPIANGGTGRASFGSSGPLRYNLGDTAFSVGKVNLASEVSGLLGLANGGTGKDLTVFTSGGLLRSYGNIISTGTVNAASEIEGVLPTAHGGTGLTAFVPNGIFYATNANTLSQVVLPQGKVLIGNATGSPVAGTISGLNISVNTGSSGNIELSIPQSVDTAASPTFKGLRLTDFNGKDGYILQVGANGKVEASNTIDLSRVSGILPINLGGTGSGTDKFTSAGPVKSYGTFLSTGVISLNSADGEVFGILTAANGGTGHSSYNTGDILVAKAGSVPSFEKINLSDGQILIGRSGNTPAAAFITGTANQIDVNSGAGSIILSLPQNIDTAASPTFINLTLANMNGFLKANGVNQLTAQNKISLANDIADILTLANGGTGNNLSGRTGILRSNGSSIDVSLVNLASSADIGSSILGVANGGTGRNSFSGTGILRYNSGDSSISIGAINLASEVSGVLPISNGGTGSSNIASGIVHSDGAQLTGGKVSLTTEVENVLPVANGGTGLSSFGANKVIVSQSANTLGELTVPAGKVVMGSGANGPVAGSITGANGIDIDTSTDGSIQIKASQNLTSAASPSFAGLRLSGVTNGFLTTNSAGIVSATAALSLENFSGILPVANGGTGKGSAYWAFNSGPLYSNADGTISTGTINLAAEVSGVLPIANGGTGLSSLPANTLLYAASNSSISGIALGQGQILIGTSAGTPIAANITGTPNQVNVASADGSITLSLPQNIHTGASPVFAGLTLSNFNGFLKATNGQIASTKVDLASDVSGVLPLSMGGTGSNLTGLSGLLISDGNTISVGTVNLTNSAYFTGTLPVSLGGTGKASYTAGSVLYASAADSIGEVQLTANTLLMANSSGTPFAGTVTGGNGLVVGYNASGITLSLPQEITNISTVKFSSVTATGDLTGANAKVSGTLETQNATVANTLTTGKFKLKQYSCSTLPSPSNVSQGAVVYCNNCSSKIMVFNGSAWTKATDGSSGC